MRAAGFSPAAIKQQSLHLPLRVILLHITLGCLVGVLWAFIAIMGSSPHPPSWTQHASSVVGGITGVAFAVAFFLTRKK
jgi:hypothetical protein